MRTVPDRTEKDNLLSLNQFKNA
ncbi:MAG: hypothetical protein EOO20_07630 [Chryseobacterium sp.]|nr:MAG: hypothetical protein EOO20_07630 [Chryseobacterium sp.]